MRAAEYEAIALALCDAGATLPAGLRAPPGASLTDRFAVHRNNVHVSLVESLAEGFPIVRAQVGEDFFRAMARAYVQEHKPSTPLLTFYGETFPDFIATFEPASSLPWLPDLAHLERAWSECWAATDTPALPITALQSLRAEDLAQSRLGTHPAARLLRSSWPLASLWDAHQSTPSDLSALEWQPQNVLLTRPQSDILLRRLDGAAADFTGAIIEGHTIEAAASLAPQLDAGKLLGQLFDAGLIVEIRS